MEELIKRLERVIQTGAPDKDGMHPISAETVLEVVKELSEHGTDLAEVGTEAITKQQAIDALRKLREEDIEDYGCEIPEGFNQDHLDRATFAIKQLPPIQPKRGKWIEDKGQQTLMQNFIERGEVWRVCSVCGAGHMIGHKYASDKAYHDRHHNFCPNCGAEMEVTNGN